MTNPSIQYKQAVFAALPGTVEQIAKKIGACCSTVYRWIAKLRGENQCFVKSWRRTSGHYRPSYAAGVGIDAILPAPRSDAEYDRKYYLKHCQVPRMELRATRKAARQNASKMAKSPQSWMSALMGVSA